MSVRERVRAIRAELRDKSKDMPPSRLIEMLLELTALLGNTIDAVRESELAYNDVLLECLSGDEAANRATIRAKCSPQYGRFREAADMQEEAIETVRSLRKASDLLRAELSAMR